MLAALVVGCCKRRGGAGGVDAADSKRKSVPRDKRTELNKRAVYILKRHRL